MTKETVPKEPQIQERILVDLGEAEHVEVVAQQHAVLLLRKKLRHNRFKQIQSLTVNLTNQKQIIIVIEAGV
jgi:intracellular sulfur oxidation DsrE/DsrF family protein